MFDKYCVSRGLMISLIYFFCLKIFIVINLFLPLTESLDTKTNHYENSDSRWRKYGGCNS